MQTYKFTFKKAWLHLKTIFIHKRWVLHYAIMCGITWQGIIHDMSKFSPIEFFTNVKYVRPGVSPINVQKQENGFSISWFHHKGHNPHHYEYWMDRFDDGCYVTKMPYKYIVECLCDHLGANKAYNGKNASFHGQLVWWEKQRKIVNMHPDDIAFIDRILYQLVNAEFKNKPIKKVLNTVNLFYEHCNIDKMSDYDKQVKIKQN